ncbi:MAG: hypothetical protein IPP14_14020 [Planctomycetes bacterium]|nr:hypothetical protein [Planctomycetota bacterium]
MALDRILCCVKSKVWLPDEFLTTIVGDCDRGKFRITRPFTFPCMLMPNGNLYIEEQEGVEIPNQEFDMTQIRCGKCNSDVEIREIDIREILDRLRQREISMKEKLRESQKVNKTGAPGKAAPKTGQKP